MIHRCGRLAERYGETEYTSGYVLQSRRGSGGNWNLRVTFVYLICSWVIFTVLVWHGSELKIDGRIWNVDEHRNDRQLVQSGTTNQQVLEITGATITQTEGRQLGSLTTTGTGDRQVPNRDGSRWRQIPNCWHSGTCDVLVQWSLNFCDTLVFRLFEMTHDLPFQMKTSTANLAPRLTVRCCHLVNLMALIRETSIPTVSWLMTAAAAVYKHRNKQIYNHRRLTIEVRSIFTSDNGGGKCDCPPCLSVCLSVCLLAVSECVVS